MLRALTHPLFVAVLSVALTLLGTWGIELLKAAYIKAPQSETEKEMTRVCRLLEDKATAGQKLSEIQVKALERALAVRGMDLQVVAAKPTDPAKPDKPAPPQSPVGPGWKTVLSGDLRFDFKDVVIHRVGGEGGRFQTGAVFRITNTRTQPIEIAINAGRAWPSLDVDGRSMEYNSAVSSGVEIFIDPLRSYCARPAAGFNTLAAGAFLEATLGFSSPLPTGSLRGIQTATLGGSLAIRLKNSSECEIVSIPGSNIPASLVP